MSTVPGKPPARATTEHQTAESAGRFQRHRRSPTERQYLMDHLTEQQSQRAEAIRVAQQVTEARGKSSAFAPGESSPGLPIDLWRIADYIVTGSFYVLRYEITSGASDDHGPLVRLDSDGCAWIGGDAS